MSLRTTLLAATILALPLAASAAPPVAGLYVGAGAGINFLQNQSTNYFNGATFSDTPSLTSNAGPVVALSLGWGFGNGLRAEIEGNYRNSSVSNYSSGDGVWAGGTGHEQKVGGMLNVLYDFDIAPWVSPYIGGGVGYERVNLHDTFTSIGFPAGPFGVGGNKGSFAYQGIVGAAFPIPSMPGLSLTAEYRYMGMTGNRQFILSAFPQATVTENTDANHSVMLGFRYAFGAPPPPAPIMTAPPAPAPSRSYLVFFDWDKSNLTDRARGIIADAASNSAKVSYTKIDVNGYTDTSGTPQYNQGLSMRRATTVAAELVKDGVPKAAIAISAFGETHLLVPTGPGVREPQNRRVEIVIR